MSSTRSYEAIVEVGPLRFTGNVTCSIGRLVAGLSTGGLPHAAVVLGRQNGFEAGTGVSVEGCR
jgi:hypothetical protein